MNVAVGNCIKNIKDVSFNAPVMLEGLDILHDLGYTVEKSDAQYTKHMSTEDGAPDDAEETPNYVYQERLTDNLAFIKEIEQVPILKPLFHGA